MSDTRVMTCPHGHTEERRWRERDSRWDHCSTCRKARLHARYWADPEKFRALSKAYAENVYRKLPDDDETKLARRAYARQQSAAYYAAHRDEIAARRSAANRERRVRAKEQKQHGSKEQT